MAEHLVGEELDKQYSPSMWSNRLPAELVMDHHIKSLAEATAEAQNVLKCELGIPYGAESGQTLDIYFPPQRSNGEGAADPLAVLIYIHGGYWTALGVEHSGFLAQNCSARGIALVAVGYDLAPKVTMTVIVEQCRMACVYVAKRFTKSKIFVGGHSAGAHLSACMLYADWTQHKIETSPFSGAILLSGIYDLVPIQRSYVNEPLQLTEDEVQDYSPLKNLELIGTRLPAHFPCLMAVGSDESEEFHRQGEEFHQGLLSVGVASTNSTLLGMDHFELAERLTDSNFSLMDSILELISTH